MKNELAVDVDGGSCAQVLTLAPVYARLEQNVGITRILDKGDRH